MTLPPAPPPSPSHTQELLTKAPQIESTLEASQVQAKLSCEELELFTEAAEAAAAFDRWKCCKDGRPLMGRPLMGRHLSMKRKRAGGEDGRPVAEAGGGQNSSRAANGGGGAQRGRR